MDEMTAVCTWEETVVEWKRIDVGMMDTAMIQDENDNETIILIE